MTPKKMIDELIKKGVNMGEISRRIGVDWQSINHWHKERFNPNQANLKNLKRFYLRKISK